MSRVVLQMQISIDGYVDSSVGARWAVWDWNPATWPWSPTLRAAFNETIERAAGVLLSRPMVQGGYLDHWAGVADVRALDADFRFARRIVSLPKFVVTGTAYSSSAQNVAVLRGSLEVTVDTAKARAGGDLICFGGAGLASALLQRGLADEVQLYVNPGLAGRGARIFDSSMASQRWELVDATAHACGVVVQTWSTHEAPGAAA